MKKNKEKLLESLSPQMTRRSKMISKCCCGKRNHHLRALLEQTTSHRQTDRAFVYKNEETFTSLHRISRYHQCFKPFLLLASRPSSPLRLRKVVG